MSDELQVGDKVEVVNPDGANRFPVGAELVVYQVAKPKYSQRGDLYFVATRHNLDLAERDNLLHPYNYDSFFADQLRKV